MLESIENPTELAERLGREMGHGAFSFVGGCVEAARQRSDQSEVQFWQQIAHELVGHGGRALDGKSALWRFMQRIEYCRHQALKAERAAAAAKGSARRRELADLATQWRELALHTELIAQMAEQGGDRESPDCEAA